jgi:hypothetical protein
MLLVCIGKEVNYRGLLFTVESRVSYLFSSRLALLHLWNERNCDEVLACLRWGRKKRYAYRILNCNTLEKSTPRKPSSR